jgi:hypothetical protein
MLLDFISRHYFTTNGAGVGYLEVVAVTMSGKVG